MPPFDRARRRDGTSAFLPYSALSLDEIAALPVADLAQPGAHLYLWTTARYLWAARDILGAWGFDARPGRLEVLVWCKQPMGLGLGGAYTVTTEFALHTRRPIGPLLRAACQAVGWNQNDLDRHVRGKITRLSKRWLDGDCYPTPADWDRLRALLPTLAGLPDLAADPIRQDSTWWQWTRGAHSAKPPAFLDLVERVSPGPYVELFARQPRLGWDSWGWGHENFREVG